MGAEAVIFHLAFRPWSDHWHPIFFCARYYAPQKECEGSLEHEDDYPEREGKISGGKRKPCQVSHVGENIPIVKSNTQLHMPHMVQLGTFCCSFFSLDKL